MLGLELTATPIMQHFEKYVAIGHNQPVVIVRDLDHDAKCAAAFVSSMRSVSQWFRLRLAVRAIEAWALADAQALSQFMKVDAKCVPNPSEH